MKGILAFQTVTDDALEKILNPRKSTSSSGRRKTTVTDDLDNPESYMFEEYIFQQLNHLRQVNCLRRPLQLIVSTAHTERGASGDQLYSLYLSREFIEDEDPPSYAGRHYQLYQARTMPASWTG
ncbi:uncharacterized protein BO96DRAFT_425997 [Aspergillus niger CBS 101883]|uniref:Uncharacterized protein n=3 Tax=Aspergillus niger TaxID=5061 RepID=A2QHT8_ASPNC|nr:uncharacterized protein BO96DRAFT_425997 [Aspergillus niger CBS 101883]XP_059600466.1 hypothetical protein An04g01010 [Aspergillus niger]PYH53085.1 hypothetical protein BO96DRAFT_425997 [Aspergillus niger CBS 101883]RDH21071.1 hypothetical protein M747DRAFT_305031 [Aspergillus niger ATCC 13496]CAK38558.1 hypothetical protein An04g01010 [Aspergillus niger]